MLLLKQCKAVWVEQAVETVLNSVNSVLGGATSIWWYFWNGGASHYIYIQIQRYIHQRHKRQGGYRLSLFHKTVDNVDKRERGGLNCCPLVRNRKETESSLGEDLIHHFRGDSDHDDETLMKCWPIRIIKVFPRPKLLCYWAERTGHKRKRGRTVSTIAPFDFKYSRSEGERVVNTNSHQSSYSVFGWGHNHQFSQSLLKCQKTGN